MCDSQVLKGSNSVVSNNLNFICSKYQLSKYNISSLSKYELNKTVKVIVDKEPSIEDGTKACNIADLLCLRDNPNTSILNTGEVNEVLAFMCETADSLYGWYACT